MTVSSEAPLGGARPLAVGEPDVIMRQGPVATSLSMPLASTRRWDADHDHVLLRGARVGRFLISHGREVVFEPEAGVPPSACAVYLQNMVITALLHQRGGMVLHASAVAVDGEAVLFCGASGQGKSTLAATLAARGHALVSDDVSLVTLGAGGAPMVSPDGRALKLDDPAIGQLGLETARGAAPAGQPEKSYVAAPRRWTGGDLPLRAIYMLRSGAEALAIDRLPSAAALSGLRRNAHRPRLVRGTGRDAGYFEITARLLGRVGVFTLGQPRDLAQLPRTAQALEAHWCEMAAGRTELKAG
ncbi:MAG: HPr kinase/phosphorylase [Caulobacteraceae bacterium]|nr:HPr kinase/phosphorylase [Caulobacteraceae bacterium]